MKTWFMNSHKICCSFYTGRCYLGIIDKLLSSEASVSLKQFPMRLSRRLSSHPYLQKRLKLIETDIDAQYVTEWPQKSYPGSESVTCTSLCTYLTRFILLDTCFGFIFWRIYTEPFDLPTNTFFLYERLPASQLGILWALWIHLSVNSVRH